MSTDRWIDREDVEHIYNGRPLKHKKGQNCAILRDAERTRDCHTEWSKSEEEK